MKNKKYNFQFALLAVALGLGTMVACSDEFEQELGPKPSGSFTVTPLTSEPNTYLLTSEIDNAFRYQWDFGSGYVEGTQVDTAYFAKKGDYTVKMRAMTREGHVITENQISVAENDCRGSLELLSGCDSKTWVLAPQARALHIGPPDGSTWWGNNEADVSAADRTCLFNDEYTFTRDFEFIFDDLGDMRVDDEASQPFPTDIGLAIGCYSMDQIPDKYKAWGSGNHTFDVTGNKLKLIGTGAHMGLYKVGDAGGAVSPPAASVTYTILELTANKLVIEKRFDWGVWTFTFVPKQ
jgi:PKD repeat protein